MDTTSLKTASAYYEASPTTRWLRRALSLSERLWPALAVRGAYRLFCTPLPPKWLNRRQPALATWTPAVWPFEDASITLYQPPPSPPGPVVLLLHGWGGHAAQMHALARAMLAQGLQPMLADLPAHGRSQGNTSNLPQFARAIEYLVARLQQLSAQILKDPEVLAKLRNAGYDVESSIGDTFGAELRADIERWQRVIQEAKIPKE